MDEQRRLSRRGFVGAAAGAAAASAVWTPGAAGQARADAAATAGPLLPRARIGIQLYSVRDQVSSLGFETVFARLSDIGIREVEFAGYDAQGRRWTNAELKALLRAYNLDAIGSHVNYHSTNPASYSFTTQLDQVLEDAAEIGMPYVGTASSPGQRYGETVDGYRRAAQDFNTFGAAAKELGLTFYQHNHSGEFALEGDTRLYDAMLEEADPDLVVFEMDIFWAYVGQSRFPGFRPHEYPWFQPERFPLFHVKDGVNDGGPDEGWTMTDVGDGEVAYEPFFCGLDIRDHHYLIERDTFSPAGTFSTAERSYDYLAALRARH
jgi:sugar phosphate isomerase/epimerase